MTNLESYTVFLANITRPKSVTKERLLLKKKLVIDKEKAKHTVTLVLCVNLSVTMIRQKSVMNEHFVSP